MDIIITVRSLNYGAFGSYAPSYDSTFSTISREESNLIYGSFGVGDAALTERYINRIIIIICLFPYFIFELIGEIFLCRTV
jgi:hypothetical protein